MKLLRVFQNRALWLALYAIFITGVFLYLLFPSELVLERLESAAGSAGWILRAETLRPALPAGVRLDRPVVRRADGGLAFVFRGDWLDVQIRLLSLPAKVKQIGFSGRAYDGRFNGSAGFRLPGTPVEGSVTFEDIDLGRLNAGGLAALRGMTGRVRGSFFYAPDNPAGGGPVGKLSLHLSRGAYPLPEPFLGVSRIAFDRGEISAQLKNNQVTLERLELHGPQISCILNGTILPAERPEDSLLQLKGVIEIAGKSKIKMNVTVGGTLANPALRYI